MRLVVKLGGSVLVTEQDYVRHAKLIKELSDNVDRIYLVVSAQKGVTDRLVANADESWSDKEKARYLLSGEFTSASKIYRRLLAERVNVRMLMQGTGLFPIVANSSYLDADLHLSESLDRREVLDGLDSKVVVLPGFAAENNSAEPVTLGRNSSDFVAGLVARVDPQVGEVVYVKDVPGVYDDKGKVISSMSLREARQFGFNQLLDERVLEYACCDLRVCGVGGEGSLIKR